MIDGEDETLELNNEVETPEDEGGEQQQEQQQAPEDDGELHIEIEGEEEEAEETPLLKDLRLKLRESQKREAELRKTAAPTEIVVPPEPDLWDDCEGDPDKYKAAIREHDAIKAAAEKQKADKSTQSAAVQQVFQKAYVGYQAKAAALGVKDFEEAQNTVVAALPVTVQSAIIQYAQDSAKLVLALGRNPSALAKVAAEPDEMRQILMVMDMEKRMTIGRKAPPAPEAETIQRSSVSVTAGAKDAVGDKLYKDGQAKNDMTAYYAHMRERRKAKPA